MKISVVMATYNGEKYLDEQLSSLKEQVVQPDELVVCDDASTDRTLSLISDFAEEVSFPVRMLRSKVNRGYTQTFEKCMRVSRGDVVFFCDQDDYWYPRKIELVMRRFRRRHNVHLIVHDLMYCDSDLRRSGITKVARTRVMGPPERRLVTGMATATTRQLLQIALPIPIETGVSYDRWLHECALALRVKEVYEKTLADYRRHSSNATASLGLNSDYTTGIFETAFRQRLEGGIDQLESMLKYTNSLERRIRERRREISEILVDMSTCYTDVIRRVRKKRRILTKRLHMLRANQMRALLRFSILIFTGTYREPFGLRVAAKDLWMVFLHGSRSR